jgi:spore maturation protein CgeB
MFYHSALSDWNHGNAHFLRGIATELTARGHDVRIFERRNSWSVCNLLQEQGESAIRAFHAAYPELRVECYEPDTFDVPQALSGAELVIVHEWNDPQLVASIGEYRKKHDHFCLFFHDTHHRSITEPESMATYDLCHYDGVLAYGASIREVYLRNCWSKNVWVWHEAADTRVFQPASSRIGGSLSTGSTQRSTERDARSTAEQSCDGDVIWIGNWGDDERVSEIQEFFVEPVKALGLKARVYGVRYPHYAIDSLAEAGIEYAGWLPNFRVPEIFSRFRLTVHIPRRPYIRTLPGIPTIRPFEALACAIPLISAYWNDSEGLFEAGCDYLLARDGQEMKAHLKMLIEDPQRARQLADHGHETILQRHTCAHRADELLAIHREAFTSTQGALQ